MLTLGAAGSLLAGTYHLVKPNAAFSLSGGAVAAAALLAVFRRKASWPVCAGVTFAVLFAGVFVLQPAYNRQYSLRDCLRGVPQTPALPVVCYPQKWDSVSFYLPRADVRSYGTDQRAQLLEAVRSHPGTLLLVKTGPLLADLLRDLPGSVEFVRHGRHGAITAGWVLRLNGPGRRSIRPKMIYTSDRAWRAGGVSPLIVSKNQGADAPRSPRQNKKANQRRDGPETLRRVRPCACAPRPLQRLEP